MSDGYSPFPSFVLAEPLPRMRSHIRSVLSFPTLIPTFPEGWMATQLTRSLCLFKDLSSTQSRARNMHMVPSSEAETRCERVGNERYVMDPIGMLSEGVKSCNDSCKAHLRVELNFPSPFGVASPRP